MKKILVTVVISMLALVGCFATTANAAEEGKTNCMELKIGTALNEMAEMFNEAAEGSAKIIDCGVSVYRGHDGLNMSAYIEVEFDGNVYMIYDYTQNMHMNEYGGLYVVSGKYCTTKVATCNGDIVDYDTIMNAVNGLWTN